MTIKIGLIGCGGIAEWHIKGYLKLEDVQVTAVCDVVEENARQRAEEVGGAELFRDFRSLMAEADVDAVDICLPHHLHKDAIVAAAAAGKHILCEKPLCLTLQEAAAVKQAVDERGVMLMCAHNQLFIPAVQQAKKLLNEGILGQVYELRTTSCFYHTFNMETIGWRGERAKIGGGELIDTGYHPLYLLLYLAGSAPVEVTAMLSKHRLHFMDGEDSAQVLVRFANGVLGNIVTSWAYEPPDTIEKFLVVGERGYMYSIGASSSAVRELHYKLRGATPVSETLQLGAVNTFEAEIADFVACLREKCRPINNHDDGINVLKIILGAYRSVEEKRTITL
ncbi:MAG: Gfo/Idh/MocA family oxidoreductase [Ktedonobacteraceae bacterium]|nr:Gfo/Idh/MocA family oxidoreductase [Ktedonobacteraceae bacterium]